MATNQNSQGPRSGSLNNNQSSKHEEPSPKPELPLVETQLVGSVRSVRFWLTMAWLGFLIFITSVDSIVIGAVLPIIAHDLHATTNIAFLCGTSFLIAQAAVPTLYGSFSECFGRRTCMLIAIAIFLLASILCATAQNITWLVAARVLQGIGAGGIQALVAVIVSDLVERGSRAKYSASFSCFGTMGIITGILAGPPFAEKVSWRWVFWINVPICVICALGLSLCLRLHQTKTRLVDTLRGIDWIGMAVMIVATVLLLVGVTIGGVLYPWSSTATIAPLVLGAIGYIVLVVYEGYLAQAPFLPLRIFSNRTAAAGFLTIFVHGFITWALAYFVLLYFLGSQGHNISRAAIDSLPASGTLGPFAVAGGFFIFYMKRFQKVIWACWVSIVVALVFMSRLRPESHLAEQYSYQILVAFGLGPLFTARQMAVQSATPESDIPIALSSVTFIMGLGQAFGVGVGANVFQISWDTILDEQMLSIEFPAGSGNFFLPPEFLIRGNQAQDAAIVFNAVNYPGELRHLYAKINAEAIGRVMLTLSAFAGVALFASLFMRNLRIDKDSPSTQKSVVVEEAIDKESAHSAKDEKIEFNIR